MAVYAFCEKCQVRRDAVQAGKPECLNKAGHKQFVAWTANWQPTRKSSRLQKTFGSDLSNNRSLAESQERAWRTDYERGKLSLKVDEPSAVRFSAVADEWWTNIALGQNRIKDPKRSENSRFEAIKRVFGSKLLSDKLPVGHDREHYMTLETGEHWVGERLKSGIAVNTVNRDLKPLKWILDYAVRKSYITSNPLKELKSIKGGNIHDRWLSEAEVTKLVQAAIDLGDNELADVIAVAVNTGFRKGNLERLTARHVGVDLIEAKVTKSGEPYTVPITPALETVIRRLVRDNSTGPLLNTIKLDARFREAARKAGLYTDKHDMDKATLHTLRHTFAVLFLERGGDIYALQNLLGHASVAVTEQTYGRFTKKRKAGQAPLMSTTIPQLQLPQLKVV